MSEIKEHKEVRDKELREGKIQIEENRIHHKAKLENDDGIIVFSEEKNTEPQNIKEKPRLYLDENGNEIPKSLKEQFKIDNSKRKRVQNEAEKIAEKVKKIKKDIDEGNSKLRRENKFNYLNDSDEEVEENVISGKLKRGSNPQFDGKYLKFDL